MSACAQPGRRRAAEPHPKGDTDARTTPIGARAGAPRAGNRFAALGSCRGQRGRGRAARGHTARRRHPPPAAGCRRRAGGDAVAGRGGSLARRPAWQRARRPRCRHRRRPGRGRRRLPAAPGRHPRRGVRGTRAPGWPLLERPGFADGQIAEHGGEFIDTRHVHIRQLVRRLGLAWTTCMRPDTGAFSPNLVGGRLLPEAQIRPQMNSIASAANAEARRLGVLRPNGSVDAGPDLLRDCHRTARQVDQLR